MSRGRAPTVRKGPYAGQLLSVDHIIPRAVAGELDNVIANLELMPLALNEGKNDRIGDRQISLAKAFRDAGLLSGQVIALRAALSPLRLQRVGCDSCLHRSRSNSNFWLAWRMATHWTVPVSRAKNHHA
jgi:hypothetical protein